MPNKILVFMGPPGSGKGTQAKRLGAFLNFKHISSGDLVRRILASDTVDQEEKKEVEKSRQGLLVADWLIYKLVFKEIEKNLQIGHGVILDGVIRNLEQAEDFFKFFTEKKWLKEVKIVWISLSDAEAMERLTKRRVCSKCNEIVAYSLETKDLSACLKCGGELIVRPDDNVETLTKRLKIQGTAAQQPILEFFRNSGVPVVEIDGRSAIEKVLEDIKQVV
ncbi:MAG: nucleoside monophosphate kinase [Candidatus Magasanikbacteria bacterium]|nr:nucleoside monophosphate kinase [Candidatus Magasanikbacteria bacterium]